MIKGWLETAQYNETIWNQYKPKKPKCEYCNVVLKHDKKRKQIYCPNCDYRVPENW